MKTVFFSVIYKNVEPFLDDFFNSLYNQSVNNFDIFLILDDFNIDKYVKKYSTLNIKTSDFDGIPVKNREFGINKLIKEYDIIVFGDSDDYFSSNRVETSIKLLQENDVIVNDFSLVDRNSNLFEKLYISNRLANNTLIDIEYIKDKNIFGLSNTAVKTEKIKDKKFIFNESLIATDWYFFTLLLIENLKAVFSNEIITYYRQHNENIAQLKSEKKLKEQSIFNFKVKSVHYENLKNINYYFRELYDSHNNSDIPINVKKSYPLWWE